MNMPLCFASDKANHAAAPIRQKVCGADKSGGSKSKKTLMKVHTLLRVALS